MPYGIRKEGDTWVVVNLVTGKVYGKHPSRAQAEAQVRALMAATDGKFGIRRE